MTRSPNRRRVPCGGFTLVELLVTVVLVVAMAALSLGAVRSSMRRTDTVRCAAKMKALGAATILYTQDHGGNFPRSSHSAGAYREPGWSASIAPYLGVSETEIEHSWENVFNTHFRSPADESTDVFTYSYAINVHFELDPEGDDYQGAPKTWRALHQVPNPGGTILLAQPKPVRFGDHLMCHQWSGIQAAKNALNHEIHDGKSNFLFVDGHVETLAVEETIDPTRNLNRWNPSLAR